jgi:hypothetical protein
VLQLAREISKHINNMYMVHLSDSGRLDYRALASSPEFAKYKKSLSALEWLALSELSKYFNILLPFYNLTFLLKKLIFCVFQRAIDGVLFQFVQCVGDSRGGRTGCPVRHDQQQ